MKLSENFHIIGLVVRWNESQSDEEIDKDWAPTPVSATSQRHTVITTHPFHNWAWIALLWVSPELDLESPDCAMIGWSSGCSNVIPSLQGTLFPRRLCLEGLSWVFDCGNSKVSPEGYDRLLSSSALACDLVTTRTCEFCILSRAVPIGVDSSWTFLTFFTTDSRRTPLGSSRTRDSHERDFKESDLVDDPSSLFVTFF